MKHPRTNRAAANATPAVNKSTLHRPTLAHLLPRPALWAALTIALGLPGVHAQAAPPSAVHPDGQTATTLGAANNGVPVVNIAAPNRAGLSHNTYQQFDVGTRGLILNNSGAISNTRLAGYIAGNNQLAKGQSATLILNEVTSTLPSHLNGAMEVAGGSAQVVVANPNGIECSGCGFINAPRSTLTTGTPVFAGDGSLSALHVIGGTITVNGQGLDGSKVDRVDLLARAVTVNAGVWANQLNVVAGANQIDYATLATQHLDNAGVTPAVAIDVSALGGMYAGVIRLVGTDAGLGVNNLGQIAAQGGDLVLTSAGQVLLGGRTTATGTVTVGALQAVDNTGTLAAGGAVNLTSGGNLTSSGTLYSGGAMTLNSAASIFHGGQLQTQGGAFIARAGGAIVNAAGSSMLASGPISLSAASLDNRGAIESGRGVDAQVSGTLTNSGSLFADGGNLTMQAGSLNNVGVMSASGSAFLRGSTVLSSTGQLIAGDAITLSAPGLTTGGIVQAGSTLGISGAALGNSGKLYALGGDWTANLSDSVVNGSGGDIYGLGNITVQAASFFNQGGLEAKQAIVLGVAGALGNSGTLQSDQFDITLTAGSFDNAGTLSALRNLQASFAQAASNTGTVVSGQSLFLSAARFDNAATGQLQSGTDLALTAASLSNAGVLHAKGNATFSGVDLANTTSGAQILADGALTLNSTGNVSNAGVLQAGSDLSVMHASTLINAPAATVYAGRSVGLSIVQGLSNAGTVYAGQGLSLSAGNVSNDGLLRSGGSLLLSSAGDVTSTNAIQAQQDLTLISGGNFLNSGKLYAVDGLLSVQGGDFRSSASGDLYSGQNTSFTVESFRNAGLLEAKQSVSVLAQSAVINGGTIQADAGDLVATAASLANTGSFSAAGNIRLSGQTDLSNSGQVVAGQALTLAGALVNNNGQTQSGSFTTVHAAALANSGRIQAGTTLAVTGNSTLVNEAAGTLLAAGDVSADTASGLTNAGVIQAGGNLAISGAGALINQATGTLYSAAQTTLLEGGLVSNAGTIYGAQAVNLDAAGFTNAGSLRSGGSVIVATQGDASNGGTAYALGNTLWNIGGALANAGNLSAAGDTTIKAASVAGSGIFAAGLLGDGSLGTTGALAITTSGYLASHGRALAGGTLTFAGSAMDLSGSQTRAGNDITLSASQGDVSNQAGDLATNGTLAISAPGTLVNGGSAIDQGGKITAGKLALHVSAIDNRFGALSQSGTADDDLALALAGAFNNAGGSVSSNAGNITIRAASIDNTGGVVQHAGSGLLQLASMGSLRNSSGRIVGNGGLSMQSGGAFNNVGGSIGVADDALISAASFDDTNGSVSANNVGLTVAQALINGGGLLQAAGAFNLAAGSLENSNGRIKVTGAQALAVTSQGALVNGAGGFIGGNSAVNVSAGSLTNAGQIYAGSALDVVTGSGLVNDGGALQALGSVALRSGGNVSNRAGTIEAGAGNALASLALTAADLDNTGGRFANAGTGDTTLVVNNAVNNQGGTLGGQGSVLLAATSLDNSQNGHAAAGQNFGFALSVMNNTDGTVYAANTLSWNNAAAWLANAQGNIGAGGDLNLTVGLIENSAGVLAANNNVNLILGTFAGNGRAAAGRDLALSLAGDYVSGLGNQLVANRNLALRVGGNFYNPAGATLQAVNSLTVTAANIDNAANATINSASTTLSAAGTLSNAGSIEGDAIALGAGTLTNTGSIIGGAITATAINLTNGADLGAATDNSAYQSALIAATDGINLFVSGTLLNRDATIFTLGDLTIAADAALNRSVAVSNLSGDIEASRSATITTGQFSNQRRAITLETIVLSPDEQSNNKQTTTSTFDWTTDPKAVKWCAAYGQTSSNGHALRCGPMGYYGDTGHETLTEQVQSVHRLLSASAQSQLLAGSNITLNGSVLNNASTIAAGNNFLINSQNGSGGGGSTGNETVQNIAWSPSATVKSTDVRSVDGDYKGSRWYSNRENNGAPIAYASDSFSSAIALNPSGDNGWIKVAPGAGLNATMSAGNTVDITAHTITNTAVGADGLPVHAVIGLGANASGQSVDGSTAGTVGSVGGVTGGVAGVTVGDAPTATGGTSIGVAGDRITPVTGALAATNPSANKSLAPPQVLATLVGPNATVSLPQSGLYTVHNDPSSPYLVETNPRFTHYDQFISSDFLLAQLGFTPGSMLKRLGDGFYEQQQVLDQIANLTGRRFLADETDAMGQYRTLMSNAVAQSSSFSLSVGVALTSAQMASLTQDIVWLVSVTVDGQQVLRPVVYLSAADAKSMAAGGATIAGKNVILNASGDISNNGTIVASQNAQINAANVLNSGSISAGNALNISAAKDILNGGTIGAGGNVSMVAGNDVRSGISVAKQLGAVDLTGLDAPLSAVALTSIQPGSVTAGGDLAIRAGRDLSLDAAPVAAGGNLSLAAGRDLGLMATAVTAGGDAQVLAGRDLGLNAISRVGGISDASHSTVDTTHTVSSVSAGGNLVVAAGQDLSSAGAQLTAGNQLGVTAGRDVTLNAVTDSQFVGSGQESGRHFATQTTRDDTARGSTLSGANGVSLVAGNNLNATAGAVTSAHGNVGVVAGNDLTLSAASENHETSAYTYTHSGNLFTHTKQSTQDASQSRLAVGTTLTGNNVNLSAGHDLTAQATQVQATAGIALAAGHDLSLTAGQDTQDTQHSRNVSTSGLTHGFAPGQVLIQGKTVKTGDSSSESRVAGAVLSGDSVTLAAGHDLTATAAQIAGTHDVVLAAGNDLTLNTANDTYTQSQGKTTTITGMQYTGIKGMVGVTTTAQDTTASSITPVGTLVGSTDGAVTMSAGHNVHLTNANVLSQTATSIVGQNVTIDAAMGSSEGSQKQSQSSGGISGGLGGVVGHLVDAVYGDKLQATQTKDPRLKALLAAQAAYQIKDGVALLNATGKAADDARTEQGGSVNLEIELGGSHASASTRTHDERAAGSQINSQGNVTIAAANGDLNVIGSQISGTNVALAASHNLNLQSQAEQHTQTSRNENAQGGVGASIGTDGLGFYAQASVGAGKQHGNGTTHLQTDVKATNNLVLISGNDTNILGAQATGAQVLANIGGDLNIASDQDTNDYASTTQQAGGKVMVGWTQSGFVSASGYYSKADITSSFASVNDISGIGAGNGGYLINVGGNTDLKGGVLASTANPASNLLNTGSLTTENLENISKYDVSQISVSGGTTMSSNIAGAIGTAVGLATLQTGNSSSTTKAGIAQGTVIVRSNPGQDLSGIDRDPTLANQSLKDSLDLQTLQTNQQLGQVAGYVGMHAAGDIEQMAHIENSTAGAVAIHAVVGGAISAIGGNNAFQGAAGAAAGEASIHYLEPYGTNGVLIGTALVGALAGGATGAATSLDGTLYNYLTHPQRQKKAEDLASCATPESCQKVQSDWNEIDRAQGAAMAQNLIDNGGISLSLAAQLQSSDPLSDAYAPLLTQAIGQASHNNPASLLSSYLAYANEIDGEPTFGPSLPGSSQAQINKMSSALLGPLFALPGNITLWRGGTAQQVAAGYDFGGQMVVIAGATEWGGLSQSSAEPVAEVGVRGVQRPTPNQSEIDIGSDLGPNWAPQISFKNGQEVSYGTSGSVRPDWCLGTTCAVEVKNYNIANNANGLINSVSQQAIQRAENLPDGMTQQIVIDIRGQTVTPEQENAVRLGIVEKSNGTISPKSIQFKRN